MKNIGFDISKVLSNSRNLFVPSLVISISLIYFFSISEFSDVTYKFMHNAFMVFVGVSLLLSLYLKVGCSFVSTSIIYIGYIVINNLRYVYGEDYIFSSGYNIWTMLLIPNIFASCFFYIKKVNISKWSWIFVFLFIETYVIEQLSRDVINTDCVYFYKHIGAMNYLAFAISLICIFILLNIYIAKGEILISSIMFSSVLVMLGVYCSDNLTAYSLFFLGAVLIQCLGTIYYVMYVANKSEELGIYNYHMYYNEAEKKYPLKYSVIVLCIDEYERILKRFGKSKMIQLKKMFFNKIRETDKDVRIYNYKADSLILTFTSLNINEGFSRAEEIRRAVAKSIFVFNETNHLQLTVSLCISEKKRSDSDAKQVLQRAEEGIKKACKFTHNITVKA